MSNSENDFPPLAWLGYGIDMTNLRLFDLPFVLEAKKDFRIIDVSKDTNTRPVTVGGVEYDVPRIVSVTENVSSSGISQKWDDGSQLAREIQNKGDAASKLLAITANDIPVNSLARSLPSGNQFYFFGNNMNTYNAKLQQYLDFINEEGLLEKISELPTPFDSQDPAVVAKYRNFFQTCGSHFISYTGYGARFLLEVWATNKHAEVNNNFIVNVTASVKGLNSGGNYNEDVLEEEQYKEFMRLSQRIIRASGGDPDLIASLVGSPDYDKYMQWVDSVQNHAVLFNFTAMELWNILIEANNSTLRDSARYLQDAYEYITSLRPTDEYHTFITFEMDAPWGELGILTPSAVVNGGDADLVYTPPPMLLSPVRLRWTSQDTGTRRRQVAVVIEIVNDGGPIDFYISCGSPGWAKVTILEEYEVANGTKWFYEVPIRPQVQPRQISTT